MRGGEGTGDRRQGEKPEIFETPFLTRWKRERGIERLRNACEVCFPSPSFPTTSPYCVFKLIFSDFSLHQLDQATCL